MASRSEGGSPAVGSFLPITVDPWAVMGLLMCGSNSVVESQPSKLLVAGSIPVSRSKKAFSAGHSGEGKNHV